MRKLNSILLFNFICLFGFNNLLMAMDNVYEGERKLSSYSTFVITDFNTNDTVFKLLDDDELSKLKPLLADIVKKISADLEYKIKNKTKMTNVLVNDSASVKNAVKLEGKIDEINGGHGAAKWALGFMAPKSVKAYLSYSGKLIDLDSGKVIGTFSDTNTGSFWMKSSLSYSKEMLEDISKEVFDYLKDNL